MSPRLNHRRPAQAGVALLEVLVAVLLFSFGILGLIGLQTRAITMSVDADDRNRAALLANDMASTMWLAKSVTPDSALVTQWKADVADVSKSGLPNGVGEITAVTGTANSADIKITWKAPSRQSAEAGSQLTTRVTLP